MVVRSQTGGCDQPRYSHWVAYILKNTPFPRVPLAQACGLAAVCSMFLNGHTRQLFSFTPEVHHPFFPYLITYTRLIRNVPVHISLSVSDRLTFVPAEVLARYETFKLIYNVLSSLFSFFLETPHLEDLRPVYIGAWNPTGKIRPLPVFTDNLKIAFATYF